MRGSMRHVGVVLAVIMIGTALVRADAPAGLNDRSWEVGAYLSDIIPDSASNIGSSQGYGVRAAYHIKAVNEIELTWDKAKGDAIRTPGLSFDTKKIGLMYVRNFVPKGKKTIIPLFIIGFGNISFDDGSASETSEYFRVGGGARVHVSPHLGVRLDVSILRSRGKGDVVPQGADYAFDANVGISVMFGGKGAGAPAVKDKKASKPADKTDKDKADTKDEPKGDQP